MLIPSGLMRTTGFVLALLLAANTFAQTPPDDDDKPPNVTSKSVQAGPIEFHVVPELGAGVFLEDSQVVSFGGTDAFFLFRIPGLIFPNWNGTETGFQVELSDAPPGTLGVRYSIMSYTRTKIAGPAYTGVNIRLARGASEIGAEFSAKATAVVGLRMWTIGGHVPFNLEVEFADDNRPLKAALIITWE